MSRNILAPKLKSSTKHNRPSPAMVLIKARHVVTALAMSSAAAALQPLSVLSKEGAPASVAGKRVALYFGAGWCPMCREFEPGLLAFTEATQATVVYVSSDISDDEQQARAASLGMHQVERAETADVKRQFRVWSGRETPEFGPDRRSGVPALVLLDDDHAEETLFLDAEARGAAVFPDWVEHWPNMLHDAAEAKKPLL